MRKSGLIAFGALTLILGGCVTTPGIGPVDVTRYHLDTAIAPNTVSIEPLRTNDTISPEYQSFADAVQQQLATMGFAKAPDDGTSQYIASVSLRRAQVGTMRKRPPVTLGVGGGSYGDGFGAGGGASIGIGGGRKMVIGTELSVQIRRRSDDTTVWEGRAVTQSISGADNAQPSMVAQKMAAAMFKNFPGESGITTTVK